MARSTRGGGKKPGTGRDSGADTGSATPKREGGDATPASAAGPGARPPAEGEAKPAAPGAPRTSPEAAGSGGAATARDAAAGAAASPSDNTPKAPEAARPGAPSATPSPAAIPGPGLPGKPETQGTTPPPAAPRSPAPAPGRPAPAAGGSEGTLAAPPASGTASKKTPPGAGAKPPTAGAEAAAGPAPRGEKRPDAEPATATSDPGRTGTTAAATEKSAADKPASERTEPAGSAPVDRDRADPPPESPASAAVAPAGPSGRAGAFLGLVLGGILAALIGAAAALWLAQGWWTDTVELETRVTALEARREAPADALDAARMEEALAPLRDRIDALEAVEPADIASLEDRLAALSERLDAAEAVDLEAIDTRLQGLTARIEAAEADAPGPDLGPLERSLDELTDRLATLEETRQTELAAAASAAVEAALEETRAAQEERARELDEATEALAAEQARLEARSALTDLSVAAESGAPAPDALERLSTVVDPPEAMNAFAEGLPTLAELQAEFPEAARRALAAAPVAQDAPMSDRVMSFLRSQAGARSLAPRAGGDPDAVLSRAEAAVRDGRLREALDELEALPPEAATEIAPWRARAERRTEALDALAETQARLGSE
jgi:hypothetical protein